MNLLSMLFCFWPRIDHKKKHKLTYIRTHKAAIQHQATGRKFINQYEVLSEIGRGVHGKVKVARDKDRPEDDNFRVAIKIIQRYSRGKRRLGKVTITPEDKTKREIAILKKIRHPHVVGLYEVIDDPDLNKIYMVLEFVEHGEIKWRRKGDISICAFERRRIERELRGEDDRGADENLFRNMQRRRARKDRQRERLANMPLDSAGFWSLEHGDEEDEEDLGDLTPLSRVSTQESIFMPSSFQSHRSHMSHTSFVRSNPASTPASRNTSRAPSQAESGGRGQSTRNDGYADFGPIDSDNEETPGPLPSLPSTHSSGAGLHAHGNRNREALARGRSPSVADSIISNMSSIDDVVQHDIYEEDFSYVPCFTLDQTRSAFRDTVLGLEYLHYEGIVHRDIKPANLLVTSNFRIKISDFGVSYFGRPIRDGDAPDVSESDAQDFDDNLELSKTVGTPAFFAPELCYTDIEAPPPKITEQIDVWSLGVTLYCMIYGRIPFLAEDEYQLFRAIANQDVHISRKRLRPIMAEPAKQDPRIPAEMYRDERELVLETVDDELYDLMRRMLIKDPAERIKLREVKRHPWVLRGIDNVIGWLDDTDPSRRSAGQRIQVDDRELERAVIPISLIDRARSAVKKAVGKVLGRSQDGRRRAPSTATSSGDGGFSSPQTPAYDRDNRRMSMRGDESYFSSLTDREHPLSQSVTCSPVQEPLHGNDLDVQTMPLSIPSQQQVYHQHTNSNPDSRVKGYFSRPPAPNRAVSTAATIKGYMPRSPLPSPKGERPGSTMFSPEHTNTFNDHFGTAIKENNMRLKNIRSMDLMKDDKKDNIDRAKSADRAPDGKHGLATIGLTRAVAEAKHLFRHHHSKSQSNTREPTDHGHIQQPLPHRPSLANHKPSLSSPIIGTLNYAAMKLDNRPSTATRAPEVRTPPRLWEPTTPDSLQREEEMLEANRRLMTIHSRPTSRQQTLVEAPHTQSPYMSHPPSPWISPREATFSHRRYDANGQGTSTNTAYSQANRSPGDMSGGNITSPVSSSTLSSDQMGSCQDQFLSHPSLPALVSGSSSVSAGQESDPFAHSSVHTLVPEHRGSPDTLTPPHLSKYNSNEEPVVMQGNPSEEEMRREMRNTANYLASSYEPPNHFAREEDSDSDSDEGLTMGRRKKPESKTPSKTTSQTHTPSPKLEPKATGSPQRQPWAERKLERRNTNCSVGSTGTAKKIEMSD